MPYQITVPLGRHKIQSWKQAWQGNCGYNSIGLQLAPVSMRARIRDILGWSRRQQTVGWI